MERPTAGAERGLSAFSSERVDLSRPRRPLKVESRHMKDLLINSAVSIMVGIALWALLPRGVVLTRGRRLRNHRDEPMYGAWELRNDSPIPIRIQSVLISSAMNAHHADTRRLETELKLGKEPDGLSLAFDDSRLDTLVYVNRSTWKGVTVPPGDTLQAVVGTMQCLRIKYRRDGWFGLFERRELVIDGGI